MGTYEDLKAAIQQVIRTNGNNEITGQILQESLLSIINNIGRNAGFAGLAIPTTNPTNTDSNIIYLATTPGDYPNFNGTSLYPGEIAIFANSSGSWIKYTLGNLASNFIAIIYDELVDLRINKRLIPGRLYRITDYITTTTQENTQSAGHPFDVIVLALSESELSEQAWAIQSERDTDGYFANSNLSAWKIWYCLDNDTSRFAWADSENGKGVIYRMIDERNNDLPYDFKNIQFVRYQLNAPEEYEANENYEIWLEVLSKNVRAMFDAGKKSYIWSGLYDGEKYWEEENNYIYSFSTGLAKAFYTFSTNSDDDASLLESCYCNKMLSSEELPNNVFFGSIFIKNSFGYGCSQNSFGNRFSNNLCGNSCTDNVFGDDCVSNSFGNRFSNNLCGNSCIYNIFGNGCYNNSFSYGSSNSFGNSCYNNIFGDGCNYNSFKDSCYNNSFGNSCHDNSFSNGCYNNSFGNYCAYNKVDEGVCVEVYNNQTASFGQQVQNYHFTRGLQEQTIEVERNLAYETTVAIDSSGNVKQFCIADLIQ